MKNAKSIKILDYSYNLPSEKIAKFPLTKRDASKLLVYKENNLLEKKFFQLSKLLPTDNLLVLNDTKVIQARLFFKKATGAKIEIFCLNPIEPSNYELAFSQKKSCKWKCIVGNLKKWKNGILSKNIIIDNIEYQLNATIIKRISNSQIIEFSWNGDITFGEVLEKTGNTPLPPYLNREPKESDKKTYQTLYSKHKGSVAAPTAGLHFTKHVFRDLKDSNIRVKRLTLHVGAGTFKPVKSEQIGDHKMHAESFLVSQDTLKALISNLGNITSVGTTSVRTLESIYWLGVKIILTEISEKLTDKPNLSLSQWEIYDLPQNLKTYKVLYNLLVYMQTYELDNIEASTQIIIVPGYKFRIVNNLITNFHQSQSTLLLLIAAFCGNDWKKIYNYALNNDFRFLSYGDSLLILGEQAVNGN